MFGISLFLDKEISLASMRIALVNYILSRQQGEPLMLYVIEHGDSGDHGVLELLKKFAIEEERLLYQSEYLGRYQHFALSLLEKGAAFACICTEGDQTHARSLAEDRCQNEQCLHDQKQIATRIKSENLSYVIRIKPPKQTIVFTDTLLGDVSMSPAEIGSFALLGHDGKPTQDLSCAGKDILADISTMIRSKEELVHTVRQIHIKNSLGYTAHTTYAHLPTTPPDQNDAISHTTIRHLLTEGFLPDAIINYLLLDTNSSSSKIFTLPEAVEWFALEELAQAPQPYDIQTLRTINQEHLRRMDPKALSRIFGFADADIGILLQHYLSEATTTNELEQRLSVIFAPKCCTGKWEEEMQTVAAIIQQAPMFDELDDLVSYIHQESGFTQEQILEPLKLLITGALDGPKLSDIYPLINPYLTEIARCTSC